MSGKFALIIGNTEYADPGLAQLTAPGRDAEDFARVLKDTEIGAFDDVAILLNQPEYVVREAIDDFFNQKMPDDLLVLYFSGHGVRDDLGALYLAVKNTVRSKLRATGIKSDYIREAMDQSRSRRQVLVLDCCNSGAFAQGTKAATGVSIGTASAFEAGYGRIILTASDSTQFAWEGDKVIGETDNSLFTHYLVEGLEGEADTDGDGRITVDELYDYAYAKVKFATPKQTPSKFSTKQQGEIILRQKMRIENIKPIALSDELSDEIEDTRPYVREAAVQKLEKVLKGRNIGLARSAREALAKIATDDDSRKVSQAALQILESHRLIEEKAEAEHKAREEAERLPILKAEEERLAREKAEAERKAKEESEKLQRAQAERKAAEAEAARLKAERKAAELAAREASEKDANQKAEREAIELANRRKAEREAKEKAIIGARRPAKPSTWLTLTAIGGVIIGIGLCGYLAMTYLPAILVRPITTQAPILTQTIPSSSEDGLLNEIMNRGYILISTDPNYEPASFLNPTGARAFDTKCPSDTLTSAEMQGFDVDVAISIGDSLGVETCFVTPSWDIVTSGDWADKWDMSVGSMTITADRQERLDFSVPYYYYSAVIAVRTDAGINSINDLNGQFLCVGTSTTYETWLNGGNMGLPTSSIYAQPPGNINVVSRETDQECAQGVAGGEFNGYVTSETLVNQNIDQGFPVIVLGSPVFSEDLAVAFDKSMSFSTESLRNQVNKLFGDMRNDGRLSQLSKKWFGYDLTQSPNR